MQPGHGGARYHFGTSGAAVAAATAVTHPLGQSQSAPTYFLFARYS